MDCGLEDECSPGKATATGGWGGRADTVDGFREYPIVNRVSYIHVGWCRISSINSRTETTHGTDWVKFHDVKTSVGVQEVYSVCLQFWIAHRLIKVSYTHIYYSEDFVYHTSTKVCWHIVESSQKSKMCADQQFTTNIYQFAGHTAPILAAHALSFSAVHRWLECFENVYPSLAQAIYSDPSWPYLNCLSSTNCRRAQSLLKEALPGWWFNDFLWFIRFFGNIAVWPNEECRALPGAEDDLRSLWWRCPVFWQIPQGIRYDEKARVKSSQALEVHLVDFGIWHRSK